MRIQLRYDGKHMRKTVYEVSEREASELVKLPHWNVTKGGSVPKPVPVEVKGWRAFDKEELEKYVLDKYDVDLDKRKSLEKLQKEVEALERV